MNDSAMNDADNIEAPSELETLKQDYEREKEARLMLLADFQNYRRRTEQERTVSKQVAVKGLLQTIIEILDDHNRALEHAGKDAKKKLEALEMVFTKLPGLLTDQGLEKINIQPGDSFDPKTMEAVATVPASEQSAENTVVHIDSQGYYTSDKTVFKAAKVIIAKAKS